MKVLGIDIGGSGIKGAIVETKTGEILSERVRVATPAPATAESIIAACKELVERLEWNGPIGAGFPGVIKQGRIFTAANLDKGCIGTNFQHLLEEATNCDVAVLNDADAVGLAEAEFGAGKGQPANVVLVITLGTGIGSALIVRGIVVPNTEFGHIYYKGKVVWEKYAADSARKREKLRWPEWGKRVNRYLNEIARLTWPDLIIIGGGASRKYDRFKKQIKVGVPIVTAELLNNAGLIGAALYSEQMLPLRAKKKRARAAGKVVA